MKMLCDNALKRLAELMDIISPSMQEGEMREYLINSWQTIVPDGTINVDTMGNLEFSVVRDSNFPTLALVAHADTVCVQITQHIGGGKYRFRSIGCSPHMLLGQNVIIVNEAGKKFNGVVGFDATSQFGQPKGLVFEDLWIDTFNPRPSIQPGDLAVLAPQFNVNGDFITGPALDDRLGLFVIGEVLRRYAAGNIPLNLSCVATVQEEVGLRGSLAFEFSHHPDAVIVLDADYATDIPAHHEDQMGRLYPGLGPGVLRKADNSPNLRKLIQSVASSRELPLQVSLGRFVYGGTDCSSLQMHRDIKGSPIANITIPVRYMHSPAETSSLADVTHAIELLTGLIETMPDSMTIIK